MHRSLGMEYESEIYNSYYKFKLCFSFFNKFHSKIAGLPSTWAG